MTVMYVLLTFVDSTKTVFMCNVKQFLHKVSAAVMKSSGAVIPGTEEVCGNVRCIRTIVVHR